MSNGNFPGANVNPGNPQPGTNFGWIVDKNESRSASPGGLGLPAPSLKRLAPHNHQIARQIV
jgi:hypothetical protein